MESIILADIGTKVSTAFSELLDLNGIYMPPYRRRLDDESQRFKLWAHSLGLHQQGHASLDYRVRDAIVVKKRLAQVLSKLQEHLENLLAISKHERLSFEDDSDINKTSDDESLDESEQSHSSSQSAFHEIDFRLESLGEALDSLYSLAIKLRNPHNRPQRPKNHLYKHIVAEKREEFIRDREEAEIVVIAYAQYQQLRRIDPSYEPLTLVSEIEDLGKNWLIRRTGIANARRKQQFVYWKNHALKLSGALVRNRRAIPEVDQVKRRDGDARLATASQGKAGQGGSALQVPTLAPSSATSATKPVDFKSVISHQSHWTAAKDQEGIDLEWPPPPQLTKEEQMIGFFACPYCKILCPNRYSDRNKWRVHLIHDLQPYHCTYEVCEDPHRLYGTRQDWIDHESQHSLVWHCQVHNQEFETQPDYVNHLEVQHPESTAETFSPELIATAIGPSLRTIRKCPFCQKAFSESAEMERHVIFHLERCAQLALPWIGDDANGSDFSSNGHQTQLRGRRQSLKDFSDEENYSFNQIVHSAKQQAIGNGITASTLNQIPIVEGAIERWLHEITLNDPPTNVLVPEDEFPGEYEEEQSKIARHYPKMLGLNDPDRVEQVLDRGRSYRINHHNSRRRPQSYKTISTDIDSLLEEIQVELDIAHVTSAVDPTRSYIPRDKLPKILTPERIRTIVEMSCFRNHQDKNRLTAQICFGSKGSAPRLELLAVLIAIAKTKDLPECIRDGIDDHCLPMVMDSSSEKRLSCRRHQCHNTVNNYRRPNDRINFSRWSYSLNAPYIRSKKEKHMHYRLNPGDVFPMIEAIPIDREAPGDMTPSGYGGYSEVLRVKIERSHQDFSDIGVRHPGGFFALKKLVSHNRDDFNLELSLLLFSMDNTINAAARRHLIQVLVTFEVSTPSPGPTYYLLFDWADGNLTDFWRKNQHLVGDKRHCKWMAQQFHGICSALQCVHNQRKETSNLIGGNQLTRTPTGRAMMNQELYGRHGDIKPANFLWFRTAQSSPGSYGLLALSDFGLGRLHTQVSRSLDNPKDLTWTAPYRAPEFDLPDGIISRASDIFSLGCVFLEYVSWFMLGLESVEKDFTELRVHSDIYDIEADTFFVTRFDESIGKHRPYVNPGVEDWFNILQKDGSCTWYLHKLLDLIRDRMLAPEREERIDILSLIQEMELLRKACEGNEDFYLKTKAES